MATTSAEPASDGAPTPAVVPAPTPLQPLAIAMKSEYERAIAGLRFIERLRIRDKHKREGTSYYVIEVFLRPVGSHIPTIARHVPHQPPVAAALEARECDFRLEKTYLEVYALRSQLVAHAFGCLGVKRCRICQELFAVGAHADKTPSRLSRAVLSTESKMHHMEEMLNELVTIVTQSPIQTGSTASHCENAEQIVITLKSFLTE